MRRETRVAASASADSFPADGASGPEPETAPSGTSRAHATVIHEVAEDAAGDAAGDVTHQVGGAPSRKATDKNRARAKWLFADMAKRPADDPERKRSRDELVELHLPLAEYLARRFGNRTESLEDLTQVATIGLMKAIDRFDVDQGVEFSTYATPTIMGEIKRYFRDKGWAVRVPRRLQEMKLALAKAAGELSQRHGRAPTVPELAEYVHASEDEVIEGLVSSQAYSTVSLDLPDSGDEEGPTLTDTLGSPDGSYEGIDNRESLKPLLEQLPPREKRILVARFFEDRTQTQIAGELGISQMHVSRLLSRTLQGLRAAL